jgi:hypothetical protein
MMVLTELLVLYVFARTACILRSYATHLHRKKLIYSFLVASSESFARIPKQLLQKVPPKSAMRGPTRTYPISRAISFKEPGPLQHKHHVDTCDQLYLTFFICFLWRPFSFHASRLSDNLTNSHIAKTPEAPFPDVVHY